MNSVKYIEAKAKKIDLLHWCLIGVILCLSIWVFWAISKPKKTFEDGIMKERIENLEKEKKIAKDSVLILCKNIEELNINNDSLKNKFNKNGNKIKIIHDYIAIKDSFINTSNVLELQQFLTENSN